MATRRFDGKPVIPIFSESPGYREWKLRCDGIDVLIVNEDGDDGDWTLLQWAGDTRVWQQEMGVGTDIDAFLKAHNLILGA
jgi:hypothetical protein